MCFDSDSLPPVPRIRGAAVAHEDVVITAADGTRFAAFRGTPEQPSGNAVVILPDVRGLYRFYEELALRFAERGHAALAIDYFGRTAGVGKRGDDFDYRPHVEQTTPEGLRADVTAAVEHVRAGGARATLTVGFCFGGRLAWLSTTFGLGLAGAIGFYGRPGDSADGAPGPTSLAPQFECPILALMGGADAGIPVEDVHAFDRALDQAGVEHDVVIYDGAPHSFFDRKYEEHADASADAWAKTLAFVERHGV